MVSTSTTIFPLPSELSLQILSYLPLKDLKSLSVCSREVRRFTSVELFRGVVLCPGSVQAFGDGGLLGGMVGGVRSVHITYPKTTAPSEYINLFRTVTPLLRNFSGLKALRIELFSSKENNRILNAVFKTLSTYEWYDGIRKLVVQWMDYKLSQEVLGLQDLEFLDSGGGGGGGNWGGKRWPAGLEEVYVANQVHEGWRFRKGDGGGGFGMGVVADLGGYGRGGRLRNVEISAMRINTNMNIKEVRRGYLEVPVVCETGVFGGDRGVMKKMVRFLTVTRLKIDVMEFGKWNLAETVMRFPNLEELEVMVWLISSQGIDDVVPEYEKNQAVWKSILGLKKLKKVVLPWPRKGEDQIQLVETLHLVDSVAWWIKQWKKMGVKGVLENVRFARWRMKNLLRGQDEIEEEYVEFEIPPGGDTDEDVRGWRVKSGVRMHEVDLDQVPSLWDLKEISRKMGMDYRFGGKPLQHRVEEGAVGEVLGDHVSDIVDEVEEEEDVGYESEGDEMGFEHEPWQE
ncbi:hypothetical protein TWF506_003157 [Arthrobotrys conoides]|uniref:F-box domain-containing protein n=1 Tax=Arthrobotrys conoides TaxID=74498 RepID=A0AAN8NMW1_9PEZI